MSQVRSLPGQRQHYDSTHYHGVNLHNVRYRGTVEFRWFEAMLHAGKVKASVQLVLAVAAKALNGRAASSRKRSFDPQSVRYDFRVFLLHLGLIGDEFKTANVLDKMPKKLQNEAQSRIHEISTWPGPVRTPRRPSTRSSSSIRRSIRKPATASPGTATS